MARRQPSLSHALAAFVGRRPRECVSLTLLLAAGVLVQSQSMAQTTPRIAGNALPVQATDWLQRGSGATYQVTGNTANVNLTGPATILHWNSMDVGAASRLNFNQASATSRVLNKVDGGAWLNRTTIEGALNSNGQVYIYNPNGIVFGSGAQVNVNSLVASSLKIEDSRFMDGMLSSSSLAQFALDPLLNFMPGAVRVEGALLDSSGKTLFNAATLNAQSNGLVMLVAPEVSNAGALSAPDGQVVLAAGSKVYLTAPSSAAMRGLRVQVENTGLSALAAATSVTNTTTGTVDVARGNVSMVGLAVNQSGRVSATTSVNLNGSIYLRAQDNSAGGGALVLGPGSTTTVLPDLADTTTTTNALPFKPSELDLAGKTISLQTNAKVVAPGGTATLTARVNALQSALLPNDSRIELATGSVIDVSGTQHVSLAMESNVVTAELRGGELADNVLLRDNPAIRGKTVRVDARTAANSNVANLAGYVALAEHSIGEYTSAAGSVTLSSEGSVTLSKDSLVNVSGGSLDYRSGYVNTTKLTLGGALYSIESAPADRAYDGLVDLGNSSQNFEAGYTLGKSAGSVRVAAPQMALQGDLKGSVTAGIKQRDRGAAGALQGGEIVVGASDVLDPLGLQGALHLGSAAVPAGDMAMDVAQWGQSGFTRINITTGGSVTVDQALTLPAASQVTVNALGNVAIHADVGTAGGNLAMTSTQGQLTVGDGVKFDLAGQWQNDQFAAMPQRDAAGNPIGNFVTRGGSLNLRGNLLQLGDNVGVDVSGGAWLAANGGLTAGDAGSIGLRASSLVTSLDATLRLGQGLQLSGYGLKKGGALTLAGRNVVIGGSAQLASQTRNADDLFLTAGFFSQGGFASRSLTASGNLDVSAATLLTPRAESWVLTPSYALTSSGRMASVAAVGLLPLAGALGARQSSNLTLRATSSRSLSGDGLGRLTLGRDAAVLADPGASLTLSADQQITVDGTLSAPGGQISLLMLAAPAGSGGGYDAARSVWLGTHAQLLATGSTERTYVDNTGVLVGDVLDGGSIRIGRPDSIGTGLAPAASYIVAEEGALLDVSGVQTGAVRLRSGNVLSAPQSIGSAGGSINLQTQQGLLMAGQMKGAAGSSTARSGTLNVTLDLENASGEIDPTQAQRNIVVSNAALSGVLPQGLQARQPIVGREGQAALPLDSFANGGLGSLNLKSQDRIVFAGDVNLAMGSRMTLDAPVLASTGGATVVNLSAPSVTLGNSDANYQNNASAVNGAGRLNLSASTIDLLGHSATQGFGNVTLQASGDVRLSGLPVKDSFQSTGSFAAGQALTIQATQVYPTTLSDFGLNLLGPDSSLQFLTGGQPTGPVLSAGGSLSATAGHILQGGRVSAPFGSIRLEASQDLTYLPGSVTSVAGAGTVPFGSVTNGSQWTYQLGEDSIEFKAKPSADTTLGERALPSKQIVSKAPVVNQQAGAVLDLSGGGSLYAYEFTPGPGGSSDVLQSSGGAKNQNFAINPNFNAAAAPIDPQSGHDGLSVGDQVYLSGYQGLKPGYYTLLPAHYAWLPGGYQIQPLTGTRDMQASANRVNADGSLTIAGVRRSSTDGRGDTRQSGFVLSSAELVRKRSEFKDYQADSFFAAEAARVGVATPALPRDGGQVSFEVLRALALDGSTRLSGTAGGQRGIADISAPLIDVVANRSAATGEYVKLVADDLVALGADSLLLGGRRTQADAAEQLTVTADMVRVDNNAAHPLSGSEFIFAAHDTVELAAQSQVSADQATGREARNIQLDAASGDGALLRASAAAQVQVQRQTPGGQRGRLNVAAGASLTAGNSLYLDATRSMALGTNLALRDGTALAVHAPRINLGNQVPASAEGVSFQGNTLQSLSRLSALELGSYSSLDSYGTVQLGSADMQQMRLSAQTLVSHASDLTLKAKTLVLQGVASPNADAAIQDASATGHLLAQAERIELGAGALHVQGFNSSEMKATGDIVATAAAGQLLADNALTLRAARFTTASAAGEKVVAGGQMNLATVAPTSAASAATAPALGGNLVFEGDSLHANAQILTPSGQLTLRAAHGLAVESGLLDVHGAAVAFGSGAAYAPAGSIVLDGGSGNVSVAAPATLDLSATAAAAGSLTLLARDGANGQVSMDGNLRAAATAVAGTDASASPTQGRFTMDVTTVANAVAFDALNAKLNSAGFTESRDFRVRQGDLNLGAQGLVQAHDIRMAADNGNVTLAGTLDARGPSGGTINVYAAQSNAAGNQGQLTLASSARLLAGATTLANSAAGSLGDGGQVLLSVANAGGENTTRVNGGASLTALAGSQIDVSGQGAGQNGRVTLRAPRVGAAGGTEVAIATFDTAVSGALSTIEAVKVYSADTISEAIDSATNLDAGAGGRMFRDTEGFMQAQSGVARRLGRSDLQVTPGMEVRATGDLTVSVNENAFLRQDRGWDLNRWRFGGQAGTLSLRAGGNLLIAGSISDGFIKGSNEVALTNWALDSSSQSWSLRLTGGSDFSAANPLATRASASRGDVVVGFARDANFDDQAVALVRTGTGRIDVAAGRDFQLGTVTLVDPEDATLNQVFGAALYTAGRASALPGDFVAPVNAANVVYALNGDAGRSAAAFGQEGGGIRITAQRDVVGAAVPQQVNGWLFRQGRSNLNSQGQQAFEVVTNASNGQRQTLNTAWWSRTDYFGSGVATLAGGNVDVTAAGSVRDLSASVASNAYVAGKLATGEVREQGGGDLSVRAGADILGGNFYVQKGRAQIHADGSIAAGSLRAVDPIAPSQYDPDGFPLDVYSALRPVLALGDASFDVTAGRRLEIESSFNPTLTLQNSSNLATDPSRAGGLVADAPFLRPDVNSPDAQNYKYKYAQYSSFSTYGAHSAVRLTALGSDLLLSNNAQLIANASGGGLGGEGSVATAYTPLYAYMPPTLQAAALSGNLGSAQGFSLAPSAAGQLELLAQKSVSLASNAVLYSGISVLDFAPGSLSNLTAPSLLNATDRKIMTGGGTGLALHTPGQLHADDAQPVRVIALTGDINGQADTVASLNLPKAAEILAGRDIQDLGFRIQQDGAAAQTLVKAGRDIIDSTNRDHASPVAHVMTGPGLLTLNAERDIDLGNGYGVVTRGNLDNAYLPEGGASVIAVAGAILSKSYEALGAQQKLASNATLFKDLVTYGSKATLPEFDAAISDAFAPDSITGGNINVFGSQFKTEQGGSLDLLTPGGSVVAGLVSVPIYLSSKPSADLGLFTVRGGAIRSLVHDNFIVNQGRVFTLGGGDITLVSQYGNIDAGRGTKTAASAPPPLLTTDANGNTKIDIAGSIAGSGIATLRTSDTQDPSNVYAVAPRGIFDAGDAGVRSTGIVAIQAAVVLNSGNISASAGVSGAVSVDTSSPATQAAPASTATAATQDVSRQVNATAKESLNLAVEVLGLGEATDDKASDAQESDEDRKNRTKNKKPASPQI